MNEKELLKLKKKVDKAEYAEQRLKGERKAVLETLKEDFDCNSAEEAKVLIKKLENKMEKLSKSLEEKMEQIENKYIPDEED